MMNEYETQLPQGWDIVKFGDIIKVQGGYAFKAKEFTNSGVPVVRIGDLQDGEVRISDKTVFLSTTRWGEFPSFNLRKGDILIALSGATTGKTAIYNMESPALLNQRVGRFIPHSPDNIHDGFLWVLIKKVSEGVLDQAWGGAQPNVSPKVIENNTIFLPPLPEQKRIAEKIKALQSRSSKARKALEPIPPLLEKFRQSVLSSAFRGDLTAEWRAQNPDIEPAEKLLERIRKEHRKRWEDDELAKMKTKGQTPKDDKWKKKYKEPEPVDITDLSELPDGWCWASFDEIASVDANLVDPKTQPDSPHIAPNHIETLTGRLLEYKTVHEDGVTSPKYLFHPGQILYSKIRPYLAKAVVVDFEGVCSADMYPISTKLNEIYLHNWLISPAFTDFAILKQGRTVLPKINQKDLGTLPVPVAPLEEQNQIANKLLSCTSIRDEIAKIVEKAFVDIQKLDQSILSKAFQGELVPQDPNDEPASVLLERIKLEKASLEAGKKQKRKVGKKKTVARKQEVIAMAKKNERRPLVEVLQPHSSGLSPEELFQQAGFDEHLVDEFYIELKNEVVSGNIIEDRPDQERVILRLSAA